MTEKKYKNTKKNSKQTMKIGQINKIRTRGSCTGGFEGGTVGQAVLTVHKLNAASYRLWFELSLGLAVGCGYSRMKRSRVKTVLPPRLDCAHR